jgi:hypothetical protein
MSPENLIEFGSIKECIQHVQSIYAYRILAGLIFYVNRTY